MKERSVIFTGDEVRATLEGRKTQFRRVVKPQHIPAATRTLRWENQDADELRLVAKCPFGVPGNRLWAKETWWTYPKPMTDKLLRDGADTWPRWRHGGLLYDADVSKTDQEEWTELGWVRKPSIHMPRWASRIYLEIVSVRVERVQHISEEDVIAEGVNVPRCGKCGYTRWDCGYHMDHRFCGGNDPDSGLHSFAYQWNSTHGPDAWSRNDWVWVVEYRVLKGGKQ